MSIQNKVALITGGLSGIGLSFVKELLKEGIRGITVADVNRDAAEEILAPLKEEFGGNKLIFVKVDVSNEEEFEDAFKKTIETFNNLDIVINNAGILRERDIKKTTDVNLNGVIIGTLLAMDKYLPEYKSAENPVIVNISSLFGLDPAPPSPVYTAAKHGVIGLGKSLSTPDHYDATGVKILTICPGLTVTHITDDFPEKTPLGRYQDIIKNIIGTASQQQPEVLAKALIRILNDFKTGDVWLVEDNKAHNLEIPDRHSLKKLKTYEI